MNKGKTSDRVSKLTIYVLVGMSWGVHLWAFLEKSDAGMQKKLNQILEIKDTLLELWYFVIEVEVGSEKIISEVGSWSGVVSDRFLNVPCWQAKSTAAADQGLVSLTDFWWKFHFGLTFILTKLSVQNFAHAVTALLSRHVQNYVAISLPETELQYMKIFIEFELWWQNLLVKLAQGWNWIKLGPVSDPPDEIQIAGS